MNINCISRESNVKNIKNIEIYNGGKLIKSFNGTDIARIEKGATWDCVNIIITTVNGEQYSFMNCAVLIEREVTE